MSLTMYPGPLAGDGRAETNYRIEGPKHRLLFHPFPRRVRAEFGGQTVFDTVRAELLHETGLLPVLYVPLEDMNADLMEKTDHTTHCPFKGDASYWSIRVGDRVAENAVWAYAQPNPEAPWLVGYAALYWSSMDAWYDEDERVEGHLRDPFHRVDVRASTRRVRVLAGDRVVAETARPLLLSETGLPNRFYLSPGAIPEELLEQSQTRTICPYKGKATYWSLRIDGKLIEDAAWSYEEPLEDAVKIKKFLSFDHDSLVVEVEPGQDTR
jgi:uncharacterized protein (DUF427 family)